MPAALPGVGRPGEIGTAAMPKDRFDVADQIFDEVDQFQHGPATDDKTSIVAEIK